MSKQIIDLTMHIEEGMQTFPTLWHPFVEITQLGRHGIENRETRKIVLGTHTGTHIDAPRHFIKNGKTVDEIPLETLIGTATILDFTHCGPGYEVGVEELKSAIGNKPIQRIILRFDWDKYLGTMDYYTKSPYLSYTAATWLVEKGCALLGMDSAMPDDPRNGKGSDNDSPIHKILLSNEVILLEYLVNLKSITEPVFEIIVAPMKIKGADGSPVRAMAILNC